MPRSGSSTRRAGLAAVPAVVVALVLLAAAAQALTSLDLVATMGFLGAFEGRRVVAAYAVAVGVCVLALLLAPARLLRPVVTAVLAVLAVALLAVAVATGNALGLLSAVAVLVAGWEAGDRVLVRLSPAARATGIPALVLGLGLIGLLLFLVGLVGGLQVVAPLLVVALLAAAAVRHAKVLRGVRAGLRGVAVPSRWHAVAAVLLAGQVTAASLWTAAPEIQYDAVYYKAWLPEVWAQSGRIPLMLDHPILNIQAGLTQVLSVPGHALGALSTGRYLQLLSFSLVLLGLWRASPARWGPAAAVAFGSIPHAFWQASTAYEDVFLALLVLGLGLGVLSPQAPGRAGAAQKALLVGLLAGTCVAGKLHLLFLAAAVSVVWAFGAGRAHLPLRVALTGVGAGLLILPRHLALLATTGNPVYPQYNDVFRSADYIPVRENYNFPFHPDGTLLALLRLPLEAVRNPSMYVEAVPPGGFGLLPALLVAALLVGWRGGRLRLVLWLGLLLALAAWWLQFRYLRYLLPYTPLALLLLLPLRVAEAPAAARRMPAVLPLVAAATLVLFFPSAMASFWNIPQRLPLDVLTGQVSERDYVRAAVPSATALEEFARRSDSGDALVSNAYARSLLPPDRELTLTWELASLVANARGRSVSQVLDELNVEWVLLGNERRVVGNNEAYLTELVTSSGELVFSRNNWDLYRLSDAPEPLRPVAGWCTEQVQAVASCRPGAPSPEQAEQAEPAGPEELQALSRSVAVCPNATVALRVTTGQGAGPLRVSLSAPGDGGGPPRTTYLDVLPDTAATVALTVGGEGQVAVSAQPLAGEVSLRTLELLQRPPADGLCG